MKKTALQQLIDKWKNELEQALFVIENENSYPDYVVVIANRAVQELNNRIEEATELLETEREQIEEAVNKTNELDVKKANIAVYYITKRVSPSFFDVDKKLGEQYYKDTYQ